MSTLIPESSPKVPRGLWQPPGGWLALVIDHNPFYLLSVASMLLGCFLVDHSMDRAPGDFTGTLVILGIINVYELVIISLGAFLLGRRRVPRDGLTLLVLETLFLVDATFLSAETLMINVWWGGLVNLVLLGLALVKTWAILRAVGFGVSRWRAGYIAAVLTFLYALPLVFLRWGAEAEVPAGRVYAAWWGAGALLLGYELLWRREPRAMRLGMATARGPRWIGGMYVWVPFVSLLAHLGFNHWVYQVPFYGAHATPVMLGLAVFLSVTRQAREWRAWRVILPVAAVLVALPNPTALSFRPVGSWARAIDPVFVSLGAAYLTLAYCFIRRQVLWFALGGAAAGMIALVSPPATDMARWSAGMWAWAAGWGRRIVPRTGMGWGIVAIAMSFGLLGAGALVSLWRAKRAARRDGAP